MTLKKPGKREWKEYQTVSRRQTERDGSQIREKINQDSVSRNRLPTRCGRRGCLPYCNAVYKRAKHGKSVRGYSRFDRIVRFLFPLGTFRLQNAEIHQRHGCKGMVGIPDKRS